MKSRVPKSRANTFLPSSRDITDADRVLRQQLSVSLREPPRRQRGTSCPSPSEVPLRPSGCTADHVPRSRLNGANKQVHGRCAVCRAESRHSHADEPLEPHGRVPRDSARTLASRGLDPHPLNFRRLVRCLARPGTHRALCRTGKRVRVPEGLMSPLGPAQGPRMQDQLCP